MNRLTLKALVIFCLALTTSCKTKGVIDEVATEECELFKIRSYVFYNPRVYERPVIFEKGGHTLLNNEYMPTWYAGYCAENYPGHFKNKEDFTKHVHSKKISQKSVDYYSNMYEATKDRPKGLNGIAHDDYHLLFRGTVSVKNVNSGNEYLLVAGKSYISTPSDFDKNTDFYDNTVKTMFAFLLEDGVYKSVNIDYVTGNFSKEQHDKVFDILNTKTLVNTVCVENVNTIQKPNFNNVELPGWVYNKSELTEQ